MTGTRVVTRNERPGHGQQPNVEFQHLIIDQWKSIQASVDTPEGRGG